MTSSSRPPLSVSVTDSPGPDAATPRPPLAPQEVALVGVTALHLCFLPWALGTMHAWSQLVSLGFAVAGFVLAALPRDGHTPVTSLLRRPLAWSFLFLLSYVAVQGLNPAWRFQSNGESWWLEPVGHLPWLPTGVDAPFDRANPWRALTVFGALGLLVVSVWTGFRRRRSYHALFAVLVANAGLLAAFGLVQKLSGAPRIFWSYRPSNDSFTASFIYPNHAGAYLNLMVALAAGLAWWHQQRSRQRLEYPGRATLLLALAALLGSLVFFSYSRMSIILLLSFTLLIGGVALFRFFRHARPARSRPEIRIAGLAIAALLALGLAIARTDAMRERFAGLISHPGVAVLDRTLARQAAGDMLKDHWLFGWGAGCFRYGFPKYTAAYPEIHFFSNGVRRSWEHAHEDFLEFPIELGVVGTVPLLLMLGGCIWRLVRLRFWRNVVALTLGLAGALALLHAGVDFIFQCPAVLLTWSFLLVAAIRWTELDRPGGRQAPAPPLSR